MSTAASPKVTPPAQGAKITISNGKLASRRTRSFHSSRVTAPAPTSGAPAYASWTPRWPRPTAASGASTGWRSTRAKVQQAVQHLAAGRTVAACREYLVSIKDRSPPRSVAASARSTWRCGRCSTCSCACARCAGSRACPRPSSTPRRSTWSSSVRTRGHLYRHRIRSRHPRQPEVSRAVPPGLPQGVRQDPLPGELRHRHQAGVEGGVGASHPCRDRLHHRPETQHVDARAQGQYPEVHRRRVPQLGLSARRA